MPDIPPCGAHLDLGTDHRNGGLCLSLLRMVSGVVRVGRGSLLGKGRNRQAGGEGESENG